MNRLDRESLLKVQFQFCKAQLPIYSTQPSLNRFYTYILNHTDIVFISFIDEDTIINYILYHQSIGFKIITFSQVLKDIKILISFLNNSQSCETTVDFSLLNYNLWQKLQL